MVTIEESPRTSQRRGKDDLEESRGSYPPIDLRRRRRELARGKRRSISIADDYSLYQPSVDIDWRNIVYPGFAWLRWSEASLIVGGCDPLEGGGYSFGFSSKVGQMDAQREDREGAPLRRRARYLEKDVDGSPTVPRIEPGVGRILTFRDDDEDSGPRVRIIGEHAESGKKTNSEKGHILVRYREEVVDKSAVLSPATT
ncbi:hypothetical protein KM043_017244 [Ampulex compressa]|nr:hypothetical protein KM043_017244 [Ampulex compressa]